MNHMGNFAGARALLLAALGLAFAGPLVSPTLLGFGRATDHGQGAGTLDKDAYASKLNSLNEAIERDPTNAANYFSRGQLDTLAGDGDKAIADFSEAIRLNPHVAPYYYFRGLVYVTKGEDEKDAADYDLAIPDFNEAIQLDPKYGEAYYSRAYAYAAKGVYDKAIADYGVTTQLAPTNAEAYNNLAWLLATCPQAAFRDGKKAIGYATKSCELSEWKEAPALDTLAAAYAEAGDFDDAVKWENQSLAIPNQSASDLADSGNRLALYQAHKPYHEAK